MARLIVIRQKSALFKDTLGVLVVHCDKLTDDKSLKEKPILDNSRRNLIKVAYNVDIGVPPARKIKLRDKNNKLL
jgi:hypothetical protein